jgi:hypothetical protein
MTRASLDLRAIPGPLWQCDWDQTVPASRSAPAGRAVVDKYCDAPGYYVRYDRPGTAACTGTRHESSGGEVASSAQSQAWIRSQTLPDPDARFGYPFTQRSLKV